MDFEKIKSDTEAFIEKQFKNEYKDLGNPVATENRKHRAHALEITLMCLQLYREQLQTQQPGDNTPV